MRSGTRRLDPVVRGFDRAAERYERGRPDYPLEAVRCLARGLRLGPRRTVVELGSGTGKLTRSLRPLGAAIVAVEPTAGMRRVFQRELPETLVLDGTAEAIPLPDRFADAVVVGQAFHWFRTGPALGEIARVLRPGGGLGLVWNVRDESQPFARRLGELMRTYGHPSSRSADRRWQAAFGRSQAGFGRLRCRSFRHCQRLTAEAVVQRVLSVSDLAVLSSDRQRSVARAVRALLANEPTTAGRAQVILPYRTDVYLARLRR